MEKHKQNMLWIATAAAVVSWFFYTLWPVTISGMIIFDGSDPVGRHLLEIPGHIVKLILAVGIIFILGFLRNKGRYDDSRDQGKWPLFTLQISLAIFIFAVAFYLVSDGLRYWGIGLGRWETENSQHEDRSPDRFDVSNVDASVNSSDTPSGGSVSGREGWFSENQADLFQMLSLLTVFGGVLAYVFNVVIKAEIKKDYKDAQDQLQMYAVAYSMNGDSGIYYDEYQTLMDEMNQMKGGISDVEKEILEKKIENMWKEACEKLEKAHLVASELYEKNQRMENGYKNNQDYEKILCKIKNNIAYLFAIKKRKDKRYLALSYIDFAMRRIGKFPEHLKAWQDTFEKVLELFPKDERMEIKRNRL